jgi:uncharacterized protein YdaU (DUF1376 family)
VLKRPSEQILTCHQRAAACSDKADAAGTADLRQFWLDQEVRWIKLATQLDFSERLDAFVKSSALAERPARREVEREGFDALLAIYNRVCSALNLHLEDEHLARTIARDIIEDVLDGEDDSEKIYERVMRAVTRS